MSNSKGNTYPALVISNDYQVFGIDSQQQKHSLSNTDFAMDIGISEDGTIWVLSLTPDPDGGGARIFWSNGDGNWNEISTSDPGGIRISGGSGSSCYYLTSEGVIRTLDTNGTSSVYDSSNYYLEFDYGGGYVWAVFSKNGHIPQLYFSEASNLSWKAFNGEPQPFSISVNYQGNCVAVNDFSPITYSKDGSSTYSPGSGADSKTIQISSKSWTYLVSIDANAEGNLLFSWVDQQGGMFEQMAVRAYKVLATHYRY